MPRHCKPKLSVMLVALAPALGGMVWAASPAHAQSESPPEASGAVSHAASASSSAGPSAYHPAAPVSDSSTASVVSASLSGEQRVTRLLVARCTIALCFDVGREGSEGSKHWLGIEPMVELPLGLLSFAPGTGSLADYVNTHAISVDLAAGIRVWILRDLVSFSVHWSKPLSPPPVHVSGIDFEFPGSALKRPYPGVGVGLLYDTLWLGVDRLQLRNGTGTSDGGDSTAIQYPANAVVDATWMFTLALQPITAARTVFASTLVTTSGSTSTGASGSASNSSSVASPTSTNGSSNFGNE